MTNVLPLPVKPGFWNDENTAKAVELAEKGYSGREIAEVLGCTRNAVIGRIFRVGAKLKGVGRRPPTNEKQWTADQVMELRTLCAEGKPDWAIAEALGISIDAMRYRKQRYGIRKKPAPRSEYRPRKPTLKLVASRTMKAPDTPMRCVALLDLKPGDCRWPATGEGADTRFCGRSTEATYCAHHAAVAYMPTSPAKDLIRGLRRHYA